MASCARSAPDDGKVQPRGGMTSGRPRRRGEDLARDLLGEAPLCLHVLLLRDAHLPEGHVAKHAGRRRLAAPGERAEAGLAPAFENRAPNRLLFDREVTITTHADLLERRDQGAGLDRHTAEGERADIAAAAELLGRVVPT